jgi:hypothetical protein
MEFHYFSKSQKTPFNTNGCFSAEIKKQLSSSFPFAGKQTWNKTDLVL